LEEQVTDVTDSAQRDEQSEVEEGSEVEFAIAEQIALLSQATEAPLEIEPTGRALDQDEVDFGSPAWMSCLAEVQGWLSLPEDLKLDDPHRFLHALARGLGFEDSSAVDSIGDLPRLTAAGLDRLSRRLQRAVQLQAEFLADLDADGGSQASATGQWREAWEEEEEAEEEEGSGPVSAKADIWPINDFSDRASRGRLNLSPSYQRGDVWPTSDAQILIESILRGIPLPSVILLKPEATDAQYEVVDGKQRLNSILRFIGKHPRALDIVKAADDAHPDAEFAELFENDYPKFRRKWKNLVGQQLTAAQERANYFPFKLRTGAKPLQGELSGLQGKYYTQIKEARLRIADDEVEVRDLFERVTGYKIPLIEYSKATRRQIHEVFNLYNKQGKHLNAEEIRNALYHDVELMRALIVASGDNDDVDAVAPFLRPEWDELGRISQILDDYGFGTARYRRTKILSWLASMLLVDSMEESGKPKRLSTARHIDSLLQRIENREKDPLRSEDTILDAFRVLLQGMDSHSAIAEAWAPRFRDTKSGSKWQELQLVASVLGVTIAAASLSDETADRLAAAAPDLFVKTSSDEWQRPSKTQTASQWAYIAKIAIWVVEALDVDPEQASATLEKRFGFTCVPTLRAVIADAQSA
jgi:hypothetical protein